MRIEHPRGVLFLVLPCLLSAIGTASAFAQTEATVVPAAQPAPAAEPATTTVEVSGTASLADIETNTATAGEPSSAPEEGAEPMPWGLTHRRYNTADGTTGGMFVVDPSSGEQGAVRIQLTLDTFSGSDFLYDGDEVEQSRQRLSLSWAALEFMELYGSIHNRSTVANRPEANTLHALGDAMLGFKVFTPLSEALNFGGDVRLFVLNEVGARDTVLSATSVGLRAALGLDLRELDKPVPFIGRFNLGYYFDNSAKVIENVEDARYEALQGEVAKTDEVRNLITRVERYGIGVNRVDTMEMALGFEVPFAAAEEFYIHPMLEWRWGIPMNRQNYDCPFLGGDPFVGTNEREATDSCLDKESADAWPMLLSVGARVVPPVRGLSVLLGADIGLTGTDTFVRELVPTSPFMLVIGIGYDYDARPPPAPAGPPPAPPAPPMGRVLGKIVAGNGDDPVAGAIVSFEGSDATALATGSDGSFASQELSPGSVTLNLSHPDYEDGSCTLTIPETGGDVNVICSLEAKPQEGSLKGRLSDAYGASVADARMLVSGPTTATLVSDAQGAFSHPALAAGDYTIRIESATHLTRVASFTVSAGEETRLELAVAPRPGKATVTIKGSDVRAPGLTFRGPGAELDTGASAALAELADLLLTSPQIRRLRITGDGGADALSRALAIKQRLVDAGVSDARLEVATEGAPRVTLTILP